jgi:putative ABC transport system permease protein
MSTLIVAIVTQSLTFVPLAVAISISYHLLRATDMTLDGSFVLGAVVFAKFISSGVPPALAGIAALLAGALAGMMVSLIQRGGRVDPLLAGVLATFILTSLNLIIMGKPNINLLAETTLLSNAFNHSDLAGWSLTAAYCAAFCILSILLISSRFGLILRALGDNPRQLQRLGNPIERYRIAGFAFTNMLAAAAGCLTAQTVGYADIGMGLGMTLTGIGAVILGQQVFRFIKKSKTAPRIFSEFSACLLGVVIYFFALNGLLRLNINPIYLKMILGLLLILFLRTAVNPAKIGNTL